MTVTTTRELLTVDTVEFKPRHNVVIVLQHVLSEIEGGTKGIDTLLTMRCSFTRSQEVAIEEG
jgi:hypothetical protein